MKTPPSDLPPAPAADARMKESIPDGFDYYGMGPLKNPSDKSSVDCACWCNPEWQTMWRGTDENCHYALRSGSPIALANGLVPPVPATSESAAARLLLDAFAEQVKTLKEDLEMCKAREAKTPWQQNGETQEEWLTRQHEQNAAREATQYGYWERVMTALNQPDDGRSLIEQTVAAIEERDRLARWKEEALQVFKKWDRIDAHVRNHKDATIGDSVVDKALEWLEERDELLEIRESATITALRTELVAAQSGNRSLADEVDAMKRDNRQVFQRAREHLRECDSLRTELARVRETLRTFYAAAEAMAKEGAK